MVDSQKKKSFSSALCIAFSLFLKLKASSVLASFMDGLLGEVGEKSERGKGWTMSSGE
jgi:hypothetical protein